MYQVDILLRWQMIAPNYNNILNRNNRFYQLFVWCFSNFFFDIISFILLCKLMWMLPRVEYDIHYFYYHFCHLNDQPSKSHNLWLQIINLYFLKLKNENTFLIPIFWVNFQLGLHFIIAPILVSKFLKSHSILSLLLSH